MVPSLDNTPTSIPNEIPPQNTNFSPKKSPPPTYQNTKTSTKYFTAKSQLSAGEFESALATIESAISDNLFIVSNDIHESLAPLYYLYGSTLLYDIEESSNPEEAMLAQQEEGTGDLQIAWENLESARSITSKLQCDETMKMDLAQIHQRLGDLQRINGNYTEAVEDYKNCLNIRNESLGVFHRSVANCHYSLGLTYLMLAAEGDKETGEQKSTAAMSEDGRMKMHKNSSLRHYLACGRSFSGLIAKLCGAEPKYVAGNGEDEKPSATGSNENPQAFCSRSLQQIRKRVSGLKPVNQGDEAVVYEWREVLDEIQETIDSSEESVKVLKDVSKLKAQAEAEAQEQDNSKDTADEKRSDDLKMVLGETSVGFGSAKLSANAFGHTFSGTSKNSGSANMLVAKKKSKRDRPDSKLPSDKKSGYMTAKQPKISE